MAYSNGGVSGGVSNKRPLENCYVPKYKPRKVSATRDFPPGCGRNVAPKDQKPEQNGSNGAPILEVSGVKKSEMTNVMEAAEVKTAETVKLSGTKTSEKEYVVGINCIQNANVEGDRQLHDAVHNTADVDITEALDALVKKVAGTVNDVENLRMRIGPLGIQSPNEVESQAHEAVNKPIGVERAESLDALVGDVMTVPMDGLFGTLSDMKSGSSKELNEVEGLASVHKSCVEEAKPIQDVGDSVNEKLLIGNSQSLSSFCGRIKPETPIRPKNKYRRRRVSAVRDFPPNCGRHVPLPTEGEKQTVTLGNDCLDTSGKVEVETEALRNCSDRCAPTEMLTTSKKECLDGLDNVHVEMKTGTSNDGAVRGPLGATGGAVGKDIVSFSPDRNDEIRTSCDGFSPENELHREVVRGLIAEPYCPWRKAKASSNNSDGRKSGLKVTSRKQKSKAVALNSDLGMDGLEGSSTKKKALPDCYDTDGSTRSLNSMDKEDCGAYDESLPITTHVLDKSDKDYAQDVGKEIVLYSQEESNNMEPLQSVFTSADEVDIDTVHGLIAAPYCPLTKGKVVSSNQDGGTSGENKRKQKLCWRKKAKAVAKKSIPSKVKSPFSGVESKKQKKVCVSNDADGNSGALVLVDEDDYGHEEDVPLSSTMNSKTRDLPPFGPNNASSGDARAKVRETLRLFHVSCRKLLQQEEANSIPDEEGKSITAKKAKRIDLLSAKIIKDKGKEVNTSQQILGQVPGVEVGDEFQYRAELAVVGIHRPYQAGIDWMKLNGVPVCTSIVSSGAYADDVENADVLIYSGQGGNIVGKCKVPEDQKLERGNLALKNSISAQTPVRVVRGWKETKLVDPLDSKPKMVTTYVYDGLYGVKECRTETSSHGKLVYMFELRRYPGQPDLAWKELKRSSKNKFRPGVCVSDISDGKETLPICAVNTIDDEKPPPFTYVSKMMYPDWHHPIPPTGCDCTGRCSGSKKCKCAVRNGGEIPYNHNGALVETKTLVYECGPHCKCPPSCYNRVTQRGIRFQLEIFKTKSRGWGVRAFTSIPSGSFICEYAGELLEDKEAEKKIGSDEYLFDIGHNYSDSSIKTEEQALAIKLTEEGGGYTIDAAVFGNIGRFINHSCSPNLYAQNVIYDHDDNKMPHVMLFAMENIPPLKELTYNYNYTVGQIRDSNGNVKVKKCYCGSAQCTGRLY